MEAVIVLYKSRDFFSGKDYFLKIFNKQKYTNNRKTYRTDKKCGTNKLFDEKKKPLENFGSFYVYLLYLFWEQNCSKFKRKISKQRPLICISNAFIYGEVMLTKGA